LEEVKEFKTPNTEGIIEEGKKKPLANITFKLKGFGRKRIVSASLLMHNVGLPPHKRTSSGLPSADGSVLRLLCGPDPANGEFGSA
jgi:hypothetical protein